MAAPPPYSQFERERDQQLPYGQSGTVGWQYPPGSGPTYGVDTKADSPAAPPGYPSQGYSNYNEGVDVEAATGGGYSGGQSPVNFAAPTFSDVKVRAAFVRKVYFTLSVQLGITFAVVCLFVYVDSVRNFIQENFMLYYVGYAVFLVSYFMLVCCESMRRKFPTNVALLFIFTLAFSYMVGTISSFYDTDIIMLALGITTGVTFAVSVFAFQTKYDFTKWLGVAVAISFCLFFFGFFCIFFYSKVLHLVYACIGAVLFTVFLAIDTQMIVGGKRHQISPEDHILGAIMLYIDIVYIFLFILQILGRSGD